MLVEKNCAPLMSLLDASCEYVGIINENGRVKEEIFRDEINLSRQQKEMFCMGVRLQISMQSDFDDEFGAVSYSVTQRENKTLISIPLFSHILMIIMKKDADYSAVIDKIRKIARDLNGIDKLTFGKTA